MDKYSFKSPGVIRLPYCCATGSWAYKLKQPAKNQAKAVNFNFMRQLSLWLMCPKLNHFPIFLPSPYLQGRYFSGSVKTLNVLLFFTVNSLLSELPLPVRIPQYLGD